MTAGPALDGEKIYGCQLLGLGGGMLGCGRVEDQEDEKEGVREAHGGQDSREGKAGSGNSGE
jgi:hypothetical protein